MNKIYYLLNIKHIREKGDGRTETGDRKMKSKGERA